MLEDFVSKMKIDKFNYDCNFTYIFKGIMKSKLRAGAVFVIFALGFGLIYSRIRKA